MDRLFEIAGAGTPDILLTARDSQIGTKMTRWDCLGWLYGPPVQWQQLSIQWQQRSGQVAFLARLTNEAIDRALSILHDAAYLDS